MSHACNFIKKRRLRQSHFSVNPAKFFSIRFFFFSEHLRTTASEFYKWKQIFWKQNFWSMVLLLISFIYKSYCIVINIRRPANKFIKNGWKYISEVLVGCNSLGLTWICLRIVCSGQWLICSCLWLVFDSSAVICDSSLTRP